MRDNFSATLVIPMMSSIWSPPDITLRTCACCLSLVSQSARWRISFHAWPFLSVSLLSPSVSRSRRSIFSPAKDRLLQLAFCVLYSLTWSEATHVNGRHLHDQRDGGGGRGGGRGGGGGHFHLLLSCYIELRKVFGGWRGMDKWIFEVALFYVAKWIFFMISFTIYVNLSKCICRCDALLWKCIECQIVIFLLLFLPALN